MNTTRRDFLKASTMATVGAGFTIVSPHVLGGPNHVAPSDKVNIAVVGAGGQGRSNIRDLFKQPDVQIIAIADPAERWDLGPFYYRGEGGREPVRAEVMKYYEGKTPNVACPGYDDFRVMLEKEKAIDAILSRRRIIRTLTFLYNLCEHVSMCIARNH